MFMGIMNMKWPQSERGSFAGMERCWNDASNQKLCYAASTKELE